MSAKRIAIINHGPGRQRGAALMVMLVIMIVGAAAILVSSLSSSALKNARDNSTADALAQARDALIGYAASDPNRPGELPCPDVDDDGKLTMGIDYSSNCTSPIGRLPWKTLGLPDLRDGNGEHLWYAVSKTFWANGSATINSDAQGNLNISGTSPASGVIAIVFAPGATLSGQSRSNTQTGACATTGTTVANNLCANNYLEDSNANLSTAGIPNTTFKTSATTSTFNDQMITISHDQLFAPVEMRIAREVKKCLDDYAADATNTYHRYPWAASTIDSTSPNRSGAYDVRFGRITETPNISTASGGISPTGTMLTYIQDVQNALNVYLNSPTSGNLSTLQDKGDHLKDYATSGTSAYQAGYTADHCSGLSCTSTLQSQIDTAMGAGNPDPTMPNSNHWPASCTLFSTSSYWPAWRDLVFYQVAEGYRPGGGTFVPLQINGSGSYRAAVIVAGKSLGTQTRPKFATPPNDYLANTTSEYSTDLSFVINAHDDAGSTTSFITYNISNPYYQNVNDLVVCVDGNNNCK